MNLDLINKLGFDIIKLAKEQKASADQAKRDAEHNQSFYNGAIAGVETLLDKIQHADYQNADKGQAESAVKGEPAKANRKKTK